MFASPFCSSIAFALVDSENCATPRLVAAEQEMLSTSTLSTVRNTFSLGREAAHKVLGTLGFPNTAVLRNGDGSPLWPSGIVGSISHVVRNGRTLAVAIGGKADEVESIGADIEDLQRNISEAVISRICTATERIWLEESPQLRYRRALQIFSAKEALFKLLAPIFPGPKTFQATELKYDAAIKEFDATFAPALSTRYPAYSHYRISLQEAEDFVLTSVAIPSTCYL